MRILFLCNKSPWPAHEGGPMAMNSIISGLAAQGHYVKVLAVVSDKFMVSPEDVPEDFKRLTNIEFEYIDLSIRPIDAFLNLFTRQSYHVQRFISNGFNRKLAEILKAEAFDVVQLETLFMTPYVGLIRQYSKAVVVLRAHNIEHLIWKRMAAVAPNPIKKFYLGHLARTLERYERDAAILFDGIAAITPADAAFFAKLSAKPVIDLPFGIDPDEWVLGSEEQAWPGLYHIGSMNWMPNEEGVRWFLDAVWPLLRSGHPDLTISLAGRFMPAWLTNTHMPGVEVLGEVPDARQFAREQSIAVVPLLSGSGIRIKIIEAMALGKAVVTTTIGSEGIRCEHMKNIFIADTAADFAAAVSFCLENPEKTKETGRAARKLIEEHYSRNMLNNRLLDFYNQLKENKNQNQT